MAVISAFFYSLVFVLNAVGLRYVNVLSAVLISQTSCLATALAFSLLVVPFDQFLSSAAFYFLAAGALGSFGAYFLMVAAIDRVGSAIASAIAQTRPLYSAIGAVIILEESLTSSIALGMFLMIIGTATISFEQSGGKIVKQWSRKDLMLPIMAAACWGLAHVVRKMGLNIIPEPIVGVTIQNAIALVLFAVVAFAQRRKEKLTFNHTRALLILALAGFLIIVAQLFLFYALDLGQVVIVSPLASLNTFFVLILAGIFLKKLEKVTWKIVLGAVLIVAGAVVLSLASQG